MNKIIIILLFSLVSITWGTTWIAMKFAVETIPPLFATGMRFLIASPLLIVLSYITKTPLLFPYGQRNFQIIISFFYFSIPFTLMLYGGKYVNSSISSVIFSNMPVVILMLSSFFFKKKIDLIKKIGILISLITLSVILFFNLESEQFLQWKGILALILALFSHALIYIECKRKCTNISVITFNALPSLISGVFLSCISWFLEQPNIYLFSNKSILAVFYLGNFSGVFGILSYFYLQKKVSSFYASTIFLIFPIISYILEVYFYKKIFFFYELWCILPLFTGILLTLIPMNVCKNIKRRFVNDRKNTKNTC
ncbi:multidrug DMT transporter permease [Buchnera aphidicola (Aphis glycines)]|uniref:Multidrug DMT transporter permease n=1 Tax=Buchnera aphidicola (Aphis glycines) TaxID=1265350 RepID=A0A0M4HG31_9GAMM|nr:DMT family transporter [Buchnera aphidicola]ALD15232.1 multidrug DMT transporter permease [Buchnera aphidicola (Aphis glycines)]